MVRSIDRPQLEESLGSIALQTWPNIEVVVIAAQPGHRALPALCGNHPLRLVPAEATVPRSKAANRALDEAAGQYLIFLDDDDWLLPGHVERLARVLAGQPKVLAAYTGVSLVNDMGQPLGQAMDLPFDGVRQLAGNLTPIHAVMFSRRLLELGIRFDEQLDRYEDWDFWLQAARHTLFAHVPGVSAVYRIHDSSGVHDDAGAGGSATQRIHEKWQTLARPDQQARLMQRAWATEDLEQALKSSQQAFEELRVVLGEHQAVIRDQQSTVAQQQGTVAQQQGTVAQQQATITQQQAMLDRQQNLLRDQAAAAAHLSAQIAAHADTIAARESNIADLMNSTSWRLTAPLRRLSRAFKRGS